MAFSFYDLIPPRIQAENKIAKEGEKMKKEDLLNLALKIFKDCEDEIRNLKKENNMLLHHNHELQDDKRFLQGTIQCLLEPKKEHCNCFNEKDEELRKCPSSDKGGKF